MFSPQWLPYVVLSRTVLSLALVFYVWFCRPAPMGKEVSSSHRGV